MNLLLLTYGQPVHDGRLHRLARGYMQLGFTPRIASPGVTLAGGPLRGLLRRGSGALRAVRELFAGGPVALVHACDLETLPAALLFKARGAKVLLDLHDLPPRPLRPLLALARFADRVVTVNEALAERIAAACGIRPRILENWTLAAERDAAATAREPAAREARRMLLGLSPEEFALVYAGSLHPGRGLSLLPWLARIAPPWLRLFTLGTGSVPPPPGVAALPPVPPDTLVPELAFADAGLIPYPAAVENQRMGLPSKLFEYAAAGLPVLATPMPLVAARLARHGFGFVFPAGDADGLLARIAQVRRDPAPLASAAREYARRREFARALAAAVGGLTAPPDCDILSP